MKNYQVIKPNQKAIIKKVIEATKKPLISLFSAYSRPSMKK